MGDGGEAGALDLRFDVLDLDLVYQKPVLEIKDQRCEVPFSDRIWLVNLCGLPGFAGYDSVLWSRTYRLARKYVEHRPGGFATSDTSVDTLLYW